MATPRQQKDQTMTQLLQLIKLLGPSLSTVLPLIKQLVTLLKAGNGNVDIAAVLALVVQILTLLFPKPAPGPSPTPTPGPTPTPVFGSAADAESAVVAEAAQYGVAADDVQELIDAVK